MISKKTQPTVYIIPFTSKNITHIHPYNQDNYIYCHALQGKKPEILPIENCEKYPKNDTIFLTELKDNFND